MFALSVEQAKRSKGSKLREYCPLAFNNYLKWYLESTRVEICKPAYNEEILEDPTVFDELTQHEYNKLVREGTRVPSAPVMNFVVKTSPLCFPVGPIHIFACITSLCLFRSQRTQIKKIADESQSILERTPVGKSDGEGALRAFIKVHISFNFPCYICC
jgi:hypothetical protein